MKKLLVLIISFLLFSCAPNNRAYKTLVNNPDKQHTKVLYDKHQIYWFWRPESHPKEIKYKL